MKTRVLRLLCVGMCAGLLWLLFVSWRILEVARLGAPVGEATVALVLGARSSAGRPSDVFKGRIDYAVQLYQAGAVEELFFTGGTGAGETIPDAEAARRYAVAKGVPADRIRVETVSRTTRQNLAEAHRVLREKSGVSTCLLVSDPLHLFRASRMMEDEGIVGRPAPAPTTRILSARQKMRFLVRELWYYHGYLLTGQ